MSVERALERAARDSYGRLVAFLAVRGCDIAAAEDALGDAFRAALVSWPLTGVPERPEAWLVSVARRRLIDGGRDATVREDVAASMLALAEEAVEQPGGDAVFPDERLKLMFICAHPAIDEAARTPLMLQTVLGLDAVRIASAFLVQPDTMGRRLSRAKTKIRDARIAFEIPEGNELRPRLDAVLEAIYAAYGSGWDDVAGADPRRKGLAAEAIALGRLLMRFMPTEPEVFGLVALMLHCEARRDARRRRGRYVPLAEQDASRWSEPLMEEAEQLLLEAHRASRIGRFQLEAAIQSVHARRAVSGETDWEALALLYEGLVRQAPTIGALVGRAAAVAEARDALAGWALLRAIPLKAVELCQEYWALAAHLLVQMRRIEEALAAYGRAAGLCEDPAIRAFLASRAQRLLN